MTAAAAPERGEPCPSPPSKVPPVDNLSGLALSGGGIRSATFNLGFLQGLDELGKLGDFDYLSTVSGGGFIGAWWSAWLSRRDTDSLFPKSEEIETTRRADTAVLIGAAGRTAPPPASPDASLIARRNDPIHFVRLFSNYLTPKTGIMSADTWRLIAYVVRSLLFTWLALVPLLLAVVIAAQSVYLFQPDARDAFLHAGTSAATPDPRLVLLATPASILLSMYLTMVMLWLIESASSPKMALFATLLLILAGVSVQSVTGSGSLSIGGGLSIAAAVGTALVFWVRWFVLGESTLQDGKSPVYGSAEDRRTWLTQQQQRILQFAVFSGVVLLLSAFGRDILDFFGSSAESQAVAAAKKAGGWGALALTAVSGIYTLAKSVPSSTGHTKSAPGVVGYALMVIAPTLVVVMLLFAVALVAGRLLEITNSHLHLSLDGLTRVAVILAIVEVAFAVYECRKEPTAPAGAPKWRRLARLIAGVSIAVVLWLGCAASRPVGMWTMFRSGDVQCPVIIVSGLLLLSVLTLSLAKATWQISPRSARPVVLLVFASATAMLCLLAGGQLIDTLACAAWLWVVVLVGGVVAFGWLVDPNLMSLHGFYAGRLARAYLGASNTGRDNEEITEAAPGDDLPLTQVWNHDVGGPYHLVNTTLNLVGGSDLATSQRLAENFILSRYHCGSARAGYRYTAEYMSGRLSLATASAISGAAVSPLMGSKTPSAALTLLLSLFNLRLGFWAPTPSGQRWYEDHARLWPFYLLRETLANTGAVGTYCYLTDGGHFDNTALYALVERGCRKIVVCDCGADPTPDFEDIGNAVRRCRIDFGAEISLTIDDFIIKGNADGIGRVHVGKGKIHYQPEHLRRLGLDPVTQAHGDILWIKPTVTATSAADVRQYRRAHNVFPQQSTAEQWYDESEFESYRRLGYESALRAFPPARTPSAHAPPSPYAARPGPLPSPGYE